MKLKTPQGDIEMLPVTPSILKQVRQVLPFGLIEGKFHEDGSTVYPLVVQCGDEEWWAVKQQPVEIPENAVNNTFVANAILIGSSLKRYLGHGFGGFLIISQYMRRKERGVECGIAYFGAPSKSGIEATGFPSEGGSFDRRFGHGFTTMFTHFFREFKKSSEETGLPYQQVIDLDARPRSALESIVFQFMILGSKVFTLRKTLSEEDPMWTAVRASGIEQLYHLPSLPGQITENQLEAAKGNAESD